MSVCHVTADQDSDQIPEYPRLSYNKILMRSDALDHGRIEVVNVINRAVQLYDGFA